jgi:CHC2 zinc finger
LGTINESSIEHIPEELRERTNVVRPAAGVIAAAKEAVPVIDLAERLAGPGKMRRSGDKWIALCPLPDHDERTPSFVVWADNERGWHCFGCDEGGDVVDLARLAWRIDRGDTAAAEVLTTFGYPIPPRPSAWYERQQRQAPVRYALEAAKIGRVQRRIYRWILWPIVARLEDPDERSDEAAIAWDEAGRIAYLLVQRSKAAA